MYEAPTAPYLGTYEVLLREPEAAPRLARVSFVVFEEAAQPQGVFTRLRLWISQGGSTPSRPRWTCRVSYQAAGGELVRRARKGHPALSVEDAMRFFVERARETGLPPSEDAWFTDAAGLQLSPEASELAASGFRRLRESSRAHAQH